MYIIKFTKRFKKQYRLMQKQGKDMNKLLHVIDLLKDGIPLDEKYHDHHLYGIKENMRECHIEPDWLLKYYIEKRSITLVLVETGSHSELF